MPAKTWQHVVAQAELRVAPKLLPEVVSAGATARSRAADQDELRIGHEVVGNVGGVLANEAVRFTATWTSGSWTGNAYIELWPHASTTTELVVHLHAPGGFRGSFAWPEQRLARTARAFADRLREEIDANAERERVARATRRTA